MKLDKTWPDNNYQSLFVHVHEHYSREEVVEQIKISG